MNGHAAENSPQAPLRMPPDTIIQDEAIYQAIQGQRTCRVFPSDQQHYRTWIMTGAHGSVTIHDAGNGWSQIVLVEADSQEHETEFWNTLGDIISENPDMAQEIEPGPISGLLADAGLYDPDILMNS